MTDMMILFAMLVRSLSSHEKVLIKTHIMQRNTMSKTNLPRSFYDYLQLVNCQLVAFIMYERINAFLFTFVFIVIFRLGF